MADYERSRTVASDPAALFDVLADVRNLPKYFDRMTSAEPVAGGDAVHTTATIETDRGKKRVEGEAWFRVDHAAKRIEWGSEGGNDYRGALEVAGDHDTCRVTVRIHSQRTGDDVERNTNDGIEKTLDHIEHLVAS